MKNRQNPQCHHFAPMKRQKITRISQALFGHTVDQVTVKTITQPKFLSTRLQMTLQIPVGLRKISTWPLDHLNFAATNEVHDHWTASFEKARRYAYRTDAIKSNCNGQIFDHYRDLIYKPGIHGDDERYHDYNTSYLRQIQKAKSLPQEEAISRQLPERGPFINDSSPRKEAISRLRPNHRRHWGEHELASTPTTTDELPRP